MSPVLKTRNSKIALAVVVAVAIGVGAYAFTALNTVPASNAGAGSGAVSGYVVTNLHYNLDATTPANIDSLTFTITPAVPSTGSGKVIISAALSTGGPTNYTCVTDSGGTNVTCATLSPQLTHGADHRRHGRGGPVAPSVADRRRWSKMGLNEPCQHRPARPTRTPRQTGRGRNRWVRTGLKESCRRRHARRPPGYRPVDHVGSGGARGLDDLRHHRRDQQ